MKCALLTVGNELLTGFTVDTNAAWIGQELHKLGILIQHHATVRDEVDDILRYLETVSGEFDVVLVTGGLGPTHDDVTPSAFYQFFGSKPVVDEEYWDVLQTRFKAFFKRIPQLNRNQAIRPDNGDVIPNPVGSARGLMYSKNNTLFCCMPGVPAEMQGMMNQTILPLLAGKVKKRMQIRTIRTTGVGESLLAESLADLISQTKTASLAFYPQITGVDLRVTGEDESVLDQVTKEIVQITGKAVYGYGAQTLPEVIGNLLRKKNLTIATAESCTGGLLGHQLISVPGSSDYYLGGIQSYSNAAKIKFLGVLPETLEKFGAVSEKTAGQMAAGVRTQFGADIGVSITGIAGPDGGSAEKPVGTVFIGINSENVDKVKKFQFSRDRAGNQQLSSQVALNMIRLAYEE